MCTKCRRVVHDVTCRSSSSSDVVECVAENLKFRLLSLLVFDDVDLALDVRQLLQVVAGHSAQVSLNRVDSGILDLLLLH